MKTSTVTPSFYYVFNISLYCYDTIPNFIGNLWRVLLLGNHLNRMHKDKLINEKTKQYLIQSDVKPGRFYILPNVHKPGNPGRPIVSSNSHPNERLPHFVDYHLQPLVHKRPSFKDTNDFLKVHLTPFFFSR